MHYPSGVKTANPNPDHPKGATENDKGISHKSVEVIS